MKEKPWASFVLTPASGDSAADAVAALQALPDLTLEVKGTFDADKFDELFRDRFDELFRDRWAEPNLPDGWRPMRRDEAPHLHDLIAVFRYKPGWSFTLMTPREGRAIPYLRILASVPHRDRPQVEVTVEARFAVPFYHGETWPADDLARSWLRSSILELEVHEVDEWFTVDGVRVFDPHAPKEGQPK